MDILPFTKNTFQHLSLLQNVLDIGYISIHSQGFQKLQNVKIVPGVSIEVLFRSKSLNTVLFKLLYKVTYHTGLRTL